jgi:hypothetical protein
MITFITRSSNLAQAVQSIIKEEKEPVDVKQISTKISSYSSEFGLTKDLFRKIESLGAILKTLSNAEEDKVSDMIYELDTDLSELMIELERILPVCKLLEKDLNSAIKQLNQNPQ